MGIIAPPTNYLQYWPYWSNRLPDSPRTPTFFVACCVQLSRKALLAKTAPDDLVAQADLRAAPTAAVGSAAAVEPQTTAAVNKAAAVESRKPAPTAAVGSAAAVEPQRPVSPTAAIRKAAAVKAQKPAPTAAVNKAAALEPQKPVPSALSVAPTEGLRVAAAAAAQPPSASESEAGRKTDANGTSGGTSGELSSGHQGLASLPCS